MNEILTSDPDLNFSRTNFNLLLSHFQYKTERDGVVETRVEQKITIQSDGDPIDHDKALAEAIQVRIFAFTFHNDLLNFFWNFLGSDSDESRHDS